MRFYLKPTGSTCYDKSGITFPHKFTYDLQSLVANRGAKDIGWQRQFGWANQPEVLIFDCDKDQRDRICFALCNQALNLLVAERYWK